MTDKATIWNNGLEAITALTPFYQEEAVARIAAAEARDFWYVLLSAAGAEPQALTTEKMARLAPYAAPNRQTNRIDMALQGGFLVEVEPGQYQLTDKGRQALGAFFDFAQAAIAEVSVMETADLQTAADLLQRIVTATADLPQPVVKDSLAGSRWTDPGPGAAPIVQVDQYLTDLQRFRDDAHIAAWRPYGVDGRSWEAFTLLWRDEAHAPDELAEKLANRGYSAGDYAEALRLLAQKGWVEQAGEAWQVTRRGRKLREEAEEATDAYFYAGWDTLTGTELEQLDDLLAQLLAALKEAVPVAEGAA